MATLYIFGDESGTMPVNDNDKPFVAATVTFLGRTPVAIKGSNEDEKLVGIFKDLNAIPFVAIVKPFPGYGKALKFKHDKMQVMARATRLVTGANAQYLDADGINLRNIVWSHAMIQAIVHAVQETIFSSSIDAVQIILDEKTMTQSMRLLFTETLSRMEINMKEILRSLVQMDPTKISQYENHIRFSAETLSINWSDDSGKFQAQFGLKLAHRLAQKMCRQLEIADQTGIECILRDAGFEDFVVDISGVVTRLDQRLVDNWKRNTGLPEPREL